MKSKPQTPHRYVLTDENDKLHIVTYEEMISHVRNDESQHKVIGKLINVTEIDAFETYEKEIKALRAFKEDLKLKIMNLVRSNISLLANRTNDNLIYNFKELIAKKL